MEISMIPFAADFTIWAMADEYLFIIIFEYVKGFVEDTMSEINQAFLVFAFTYRENF